MAQALAAVGDFAAGKLEAQAQAIIAKVGGIGCITVTVPNGRF
jgi:5,10-methylene-tetrahydrofolate dehydrogenase/methenyl tetrahydrofolate cyclohydrolase